MRTTALGSSLIATSLALSLWTPVALAQPALERGLGGPNDYGTSCLSPNDDGSSVMIPLAAAFPDGLNFFGTVHRNMYVNTNGNITFSGAVSTFTPSAFPLVRDTPTPMIAAYWADVDIRGRACSGSGGNLWGTGGGCRLTPGATNGVYWHTEPGRAVITWDRVGYYSCSDELQMTFQMILTTVPSCGDPGDFDVEFRYTQCEWNTGNASGGTDGFSERMASPSTCRSDTDCAFPGRDAWIRPDGGPPSTGNSRCEILPGMTTGTCWTGIPAQVGFDAANGRDYVQLPASRTSRIHESVCEESNVGMPGVWRFQVRRGGVVCPDAGDVCDTGMPGACAQGRSQCVAAGVECRPVVTSTTERCDAIDNDCDGTVDESGGGAMLCRPGAICRSGTCVDRCFDNTCGEGYECERATNACVPMGCIGVECREGERCFRGRCGDACAGIDCPGNQECREGQCVDLCATLTCDDCTACEPSTGSCIDRCPARPCAAGQSCTPEGRCVPAGCVGVTCDPGFVCAAGGDCVDACEGAACPVGQECRMGACVEPPPVPDAGRPDVGPVDAAMVPDAGMDSGPSILADAAICGRRCQMEMNRGCGCSVPAPRRAPAGFAFVGLLGLAAFARRRR